MKSSFAEPEPHAEQRASHVAGTTAALGAVHEGFNHLGVNERASIPRNRQLSCSCFLTEF